MGSYLIAAWQCKQWDRRIAHCAPYDIYHTSSYHVLLQEEGAPLLFACEKGVLPFVAKGDKATSVYGYPGPLGVRMYSDKFRETNAADFQEALKGCFAELGVRHFETRLHPLIDTSYLLEGMCEIEQVGTTVAVDLRKPRSEQEREISKGHRADIKKASHLVVERDFHFAHMGAFINAYRETMDRAGANKTYYFSDGYFNRLATFHSMNVSLWHAWDKDEIVSSAVFFHCDRFAQYHLAATPNEHIKAQGGKAIINRAIAVMRSCGHHWLHLGGGLGGEQDALFTFKKGFSRTRLPFCVARWEG